jgi:hypothetical protein
MLLQLKALKKNWEMMFVATKLFTLLPCDGDGPYFVIITMVMVVMKCGGR